MTLQDVFAQMRKVIEDDSKLTDEEKWKIMFGGPFPKGGG